jgi:NAD(P)-dependent dehydrogenase (short-subunit alcohol dehydrogenase family)
MARRGARNLILPSRSGASSHAARGLVSELSEQGVRVLVPKCDVSSFDSLSGLMDDCRRDLPPIKGFINAAMALQVCYFTHLSYRILTC